MYKRIRHLNLTSGIRVDATRFSGGGGRIGKNKDFPFCQGFFGQSVIEGDGKV